jgi:hypothetical protein
MVVIRHRDAERDSTLDRQTCRRIGQRRVCPFDSIKNEPSGGKLHCTLLHKPYAGRFCELRACGIYRPFAGLRAKGQLLRSDESDIGDAYKA